MIKVLINAYACSPGMGSEPGMAWNWCVHLAKHCELHIITEGEFKDKIEAALPTLPQSKNMHFYYNPVSDEVRKMCWNQGDWRFYSHYKKWQYKTYEIAKEILKNEKIDILHQLNMIGFREPGYLWKIKNIPFVWGPVDAKSSFPTAYLDGATLKQKLFIHIKNAITHMQLKYASRVHKAAENADLIVAASSNSGESFKKYFQKDAVLLNETGCSVQVHPVIDKSKKETLDLLWVGKLDFRKQLGLAIRSVAKTGNKNIRLHIVGAGDDRTYRELASALHIESMCIWHGLISHSDVQKLMQQSDLFFFTSVAEGTPHVVLEAIANNLPVLCFDTCGHGDSVNDKVGFKIPLSTPEKSIESFAQIVSDVFDKKCKLDELAANCSARQIELSWDNKAESMLKLYKNAIRS